MYYTHKIPARPACYVFETSGDAYDAVQCLDEIKTGDTLHIPAEKVVGVAYTWPIAVTVEAGKLHTLDLNHPEGRRKAEELRDALLAAMAVASQGAQGGAGYEIRPELEDWQARGIIEAARADGVHITAGNVGDLLADNGMPGAAEWLGKIGRAVLEELEPAGDAEDSHHCGGDDY